MNDAGVTEGRKSRRWLSDLKVYAEPKVARMLLLGFSAGLPLLLVLGTLSYRLREAGIDRTTIGFLSWVGLAYGFKWMWAPLVDRLPLPLLTRRLGRRRSWLLLAQAGIVAGLVGMALTDAARTCPCSWPLLCWWRFPRPRRTSRWMPSASSRPRSRIRPRWRRPTR